MEAPFSSDLAGPQVEESSPLSALDQSTPFPEGLSETYINELGSKLLYTLRQYEAAHVEDRARLEKCYKEYSFISDRKTSKLYSNVSFPYTVTRIRSLHARMVDGMLSLDPLIRVEADVQGDPGLITQQGLDMTLFQAQALEQIASRQFKLGTPKKDTMACGLDAITFGRCIAELGWSSVGDEANGVPEREGVCSPRISPALFMADPRARTVQEAIVTLKIIPTHRALADQMVRSGRWEKDVADEIVADLGYNWTTEASSLFQRLRETRKMYDATPVGWTDTVEAMLRLDPLNTGTARFWRVWFLPTTGKVLGMRPSSYKGGERRPIVVGCIWPIPDSLYGMSMVELLYPTSHLKNAVMNLWLDNAKWAANIRFLLNKAARIEEGELKMSVPGGFIHGYDITESGIRPFQATSVAPDLLNFQGRLDHDEMEASAVSPITLGMRAASTATGTSAVQNESYSNIDILSEYWKVTFLDELAQGYVDLIQQYQDEGESVHISTPDGGDFRSMATRNDLGGRFIATFSAMQEAGQRKSIAQLLMTLSAVMVQGGAVPVTDMAKLIMQYSGLPGDDLARITSVLDRAAAAQAAALQAAAQGGGSAGPGAPPGAPTPPSPGGYQGQPTPNQPGVPAPSFGLSRPQIRPGPGGDYPADIPGSMG